MELPRWRVNARPKPLSRYRRVDGQLVTNEKRVRVRRVDGEPMALAVVERHGYASLLTEAELEFVRTIAEQRRWTLHETYSPLLIPKYPHLDGDLDCNADLLARLNRVAMRLSRSEGRKVVIFVRSGRRTMDEQWALYRKYGSPRAAYPNANAPHIRGVAADCGINGLDIGDYPGARAAMRAEGLSLRVAGEDWHVEIGEVWNA
jgi:hypothetical protein